MYDICIVGAGASGMSAAIMAKRANPELKICILEKKEQIGKKILASGNGRCNLSNENCEHFQEVQAFFQDLGIFTMIEEEGRVYPYCQKASSIVKALEIQLEMLNVKIICQESVTGISITSKGFCLICDNKANFTACKVLLSTGGKAAPQFGTAGDGYSFATKLGHSVSKLIPILTPIECCGDYSRLKGIRANVNLLLVKNNEQIAEEKGQIQFTSDGISGICVFNLTRFILVDEGKNIKEGLAEYCINIDFFPDVSMKVLIDMVKCRSRKLKVKCKHLLNSMINEELAYNLFFNLRIDENKKSENLSECEIKKICENLKRWKVKIKGIKGWKDAQCTKGGIVSEEVDENTMESRMVKGLYFAGEILDYDGPCGGYNLQNAWYTGIIAGKNMAIFNEKEKGK